MTTTTYTDSIAVTVAELIWSEKWECKTILYATLENGNTWVYKSSSGHSFPYQSSKWDLPNHRKYDRGSKSS